MRKLWLCILVSLLASTHLARADEAPPPGSRMKKAGIALLIVGALGLAATVVGIGLAAHPCPNDIDQPGCHVISGSILAGAGGVTALTAFAVGVPLYVVGKHRERRSIGALSAMPTFEQGAAGLAARYTLRF